MNNESELLARIKELEARLNFKRECPDCKIKGVDLGGYCPTCDEFTASSTLRDQIAQQTRAALIKRVREIETDYETNYGRNRSEFGVANYIRTELEKL